MNEMERLREQKPVGVRINAVLYTHSTVQSCILLDFRQAMYSEDVPACV
jgi:hypothetical protein